MTNITEIDAQALKTDIVDRFLRYVRVWTTSDKHAETTPTSPGQWDLARLLMAELQSGGITDLELTDHCYVIARIPENQGGGGRRRPGLPLAPAASRLPLPPPLGASPPSPQSPRSAATQVIGFLAHLDTASEVSGKDVKPVYDVEAGIIRSDGSTLLGADDKAGIAEIVSAAVYLVAHPEIPHGPIELIFTPDEETGKGLPCFPMEKIKAKACYTLDGGPAGEIEIECFNAYEADISFEGKSIHPGAARGVLVNAALMAASYAAMLPRSESPESTDGYYGYYCVMDISGSVEKATLNLIIRDFSREGMTRRIAALENFARAVEAQFPGGKVIVDAKPSYYNMKEKIDEQPDVTDTLKEAAKNCGVAWTLKPVRGGTDGSRLTELGIPTPNIFTGGRNFHSRDEWVSVDDMLAASRIIIELAALWGA